MARYKITERDQGKFIPVCFDLQIQPGTFEYTLDYLIDNKVDFSVFVKEQLDGVRHSLCEWTNYCANHEVFATCVPIKWDYLQERPNKGDTIRGERRMHLHRYEVMGIQGVRVSVLLNLA